MSNSYEKTRIPGINLRNGTYHLRKTYLGVEIHGPTGIPKGKLAEAEALLLKKQEEIRLYVQQGETPEVTFEEAALEYVKRNDDLAQIENYKKSLARMSDHYLGWLPVSEIHQDHTQVQKLISDLKTGDLPWERGRGHKPKTPKPRKKKTIRSYVELIGRVQNFCHKDWRDENTGRPYLTSVPRYNLKKFKDDSRPPKALTWPQQRIFEKATQADHIQLLFLFGVNSGLRDREILNLRWHWEHEMDDCERFFVLPGYYDGKRITKNGEPRILVCNSVCRSILDRLRGVNDEFVFTYKGEPLTRVINTAWKNARAEAGLHDPALLDLRFHDCRHTFGHRLKSAGVEKRTRTTLLGHKHRDITDHYSQEDVLELQEAAEKVTQQSKSVPILSLEAMQNTAQKKINR